MGKCLLAWNNLIDLRCLLDFNFLLFFFVGISFDYFDLCKNLYFMEINWILTCVTSSSMLFPCGATYVSMCENNSKSSTLIERSIWTHGILNSTKSAHFPFFKLFFTKFIIFSKVSSLEQLGQSRVISEIAVKRNAYILYFSFHS